MSPLDAATLRSTIAGLDLTHASATVVGHGFVGSEYVKALDRLGVRHVRVCSRTERSLEKLRARGDLELVAGGFEALREPAREGEVAIVGTPVALVPAAARRLVALGYKTLLLEKPVALESSAVASLARELSNRGVRAHVAWNRVAYPSFQEARARCLAEGGVTSFGYTFTEMIKPDWPQRFPADELARWGVANSLHVIGMAHALGGLPRSLATHRGGEGRLSWHDHATFVGAGVADSGAAFSYHADWGSTGRWSIELHTKVASYRFCPLEELRRKTAPLADWELVPVAAFAPDVKVGFVEEVAALLSPRVAGSVSLPTLDDTAGLVRLAEQIFGYAGA